MRIDPSFTKASFNLALAYTRVKRTDDATAVLKQLLAADPKNTQVLSAYGWALHLAGKDEDALKQYETVITLSPADQGALYNAGILLWKLGRKSEALARFRAVLNLAADDTDSLYAAGSLLLDLGDAAASEEMLERYVDKKPNDTEAWYMIAAGAEKQQRYARALEAYDKVLAIDAKQADAWFGEARLLLTVVQDPDRGLDALAKAIANGFKDAAAIKVLLDTTILVERDKVEELLKKNDLMPKEAAGAAAAPQPAVPSPPQPAAPAQGGGGTKGTTSSP